MNQEIDNEEYISIRRQSPLVWRVDFPSLAPHLEEEDQGSHAGGIDHGVAV
jgi:hypothetical protein